MRLWILSLWSSGINFCFPATICSVDFDCMDSLSAERRVRDAAVEFTRCKTVNFSAHRLINLRRGNEMSEMANVGGAFGESYFVAGDAKSYFGSYFGRYAFTLE